MLILNEIYYYRNVIILNYNKRNFGYLLVVYKVQQLFIV